MVTVLKGMRRSMAARHSRPNEGSAINSLQTKASRQSPFLHLKVRVSFSPCTLEWSGKSIPLWYSCRSLVGCVCNTHITTHNVYAPSLKSSRAEAHFEHREGILLSFVHPQGLEYNSP